jgi:hypothetical protein
LHSEAFSLDSLFGLLKLSFGFGDGSSEIIYLSALLGVVFLYERNLSKKESDMFSQQG